MHVVESFLFKPNEAIHGLESFLFKPN
jgi:hypothetical protein